MSTSSVEPGATPGPLITVRLLGRGEELLREQLNARPDMELPVRISGPRDRLTPLSLIQDVAEQNPLLRDHIVRVDGSPRSSTRILLNGVPPTDLAMPLEVSSPRPVKAGEDVAFDVAVDIHADVHISVGGIRVDVEIAIVVPCDG